LIGVVEKILKNLVMSLNISTFNFLCFLLFEVLAECMMFENPNNTESNNSFFIGFIYLNKLIERIVADDDSFF